MIALITSCINPVDIQAPVKSYFAPGIRLEQTLITIEKLRSSGFSNIYLLDNSGNLDPRPIRESAGDVLIRHINQYQFTNKGINELLLLLTVLQELPDNVPLFKISGRYYPDENFEAELGNADFRFRGYNFHSKRGTVSTRGYFVRNKKIYEQFLLETLQETFSYTKRIVGLRSAGQALKEILQPWSPADNRTAIELASAKVLKNNNYNVTLSDKIGIEGRVAGFNTLDLIKE